MVEYLRSNSGMRAWLFCATEAKTDLKKFEINVSADVYTFFGNDPSNVVIFGSQISDTGRSTVNTDICVKGQYPLVESGNWNIDWVCMEAKLI